VTRCNFGPAAPEESIVYGACRPDHRLAGTTATDPVAEWLQVMENHEIKRVCCLLDQKLAQYDGLLERYREAFGSKKVRHAPITDFQVVSESALHGEILPFLDDANRANEHTVVHCSAGMGRTGHILALWLVHGRDYSLDKAIKTVEQQGRTPLEIATRDELKYRLK